MENHAIALLNGRIAVSLRDLKYLSQASNAFLFKLREIVKELSCLRSRTPQFICVSVRTRPAQDLCAGRVQ